MANNIDLVVGSEAIKQVENLVAKLTLADAELLKVSQSALNASKSIAGISTPSGLDKSVQSNKELTEQLNRQNLTIKELELSIKKLSQVRQNNNKVSAEESVNQRILNQNAIAQAKATSNLVGAYQKLDLEHKKLVVSAQNIGVKFGSNSREFKNASEKANVLDRELKKIDATLGKSQRNVGNYSSAFNGLGNILGAFGVATGVAGVAMLATNIFNTTKELESLNNALRQVSETEEELATNQAFLSRISEAYGVEIKGLTQQFTQFYVSAKDKLAGNEIQSIFESVTKAGASMGLSVQSQERAFLALNQMMSKGTIQAEELRGQLGEALPGALGIMAKAVGVNEKELAKMMKSGDLIASEVLPKFAKQLEITYGIDQLKRVENLSSAQTRLGNSWTEFIGSLNEGGGKLSGFLTTTLDYLNLIVAGLKDFNATYDSIRGKQASNAKSSQSSYFADIKDPNERKALAELTKKDAVKNITELNEKLAQANHAYELYNKVSLLNLSPSRISLRKQAKAEMDEYNASLGTQRGRLQAANEVLNGGTKIQQTNTIAINENTKAKEKNLKRDKIESVGTPTIANGNSGALENLKNLKKALEQTRDETAKNAIEFDKFNKSIDDVNKAIEVLTKPLTVDVNIKTPLAEVKKQAEETSQYLKSFISELGSNLGFSETLNIFSDEFDFMERTAEEKTVAIMESFQEMYNFIANASQANFDGEKQRLQDQYDLSLTYAGDSAVAKAKLAEDLEKRQKEIANRENKAKQKQAIFNIAIDTAQGVISALASTPPNVPLSILVGALGAAQIAVVASQKIPQYKDGTMNHSGGLMLVNDGSGSNFQEKVITPDGKEFTPQGRNVLIDAPKGTKVLNHEQQIHAMLSKRGISMSSTQKSNGMTAQEMDLVLGKHFKNIQTNNTTFDKNGIRMWSEKNGNRTIRDNNRVAGNGFKV